jgi:hypothetical protein
LASALLSLGWPSYTVDDGGHVGGAIELDLGQATTIGGDDPRDLCGQREEVRLAEISREPFPHSLRQGGASGLRTASHKFFTKQRDRVGWSLELEELGEPQYWKSYQMKAGIGWVEGTGNWAHGYGGGAPIWDVQTCASMCGMGTLADRTFLPSHSGFSGSKLIAKSWDTCEDKVRAVRG